MSGGVAEVTSDDDAQSLFKRADEALYRAKRDGKGDVRLTLESCSSWR